MPHFSLNDRTRISIVLALSAGEADPLRRERQEVKARKLGMTGAEVDAARRGSSFDARASLAVTFAVAIMEGAKEAVECKRDRMLKAGFGEETLSEIEAIVRIASCTDRVEYPV